MSTENIVFLRGFTVNLMTMAIDIVVVAEIGANIRRAQQDSLPIIQRDHEATPLHLNAATERVNKNKTF